MKMKWNNIENQPMPKERGKYFVIDLTGKYSDPDDFLLDVVKYEDGLFCNIDGKPYKEKQIYNWMPLPDPPTSSQADPLAKE